MSWREILGAASLMGDTYPQYPHNPQNRNETGNFVDIADIADRDSEEEHSKILEELSTACKELEISPAEVKNSLSPVDIEDWRKGSISSEALAAYARSLEQRREMDKGKCPAHYTKRANCKHCGPVWLWFSGDVLGCPWCWNRGSGKPIPRP